MTDTYLQNHLRDLRNEERANARALLPSQELELARLTKELPELERAVDDAPDDYERRAARRQLQNARARLESLQYNVDAARRLLNEG